MRALANRVAAICGKPVRDIAPLSGGSVAHVSRVRFADGSAVVVKQGGKLALEGWTLGELAGRLPVPRVIHAEDALLILEYVEAGDAIDASAQRHAAALLATLHDVPPDRQCRPARQCRHPRQAVRRTSSHSP